MLTCNKEKEFGLEKEQSKPRNAEFSAFSKSIVCHSAADFGNCVAVYFFLTPEPAEES